MFNLAIKILVISTQSLSLTVFNDLTFQSRCQDFSYLHLEADNTPTNVLWEFQSHHQDFGCCHFAISQLQIIADVFQSRY